ncbi:hypothetical protein Pmar_PMAR014168 [Perkinsus marinus ATCC 50983]|uniref:Uncharacterized protein n=1 Tax=Perkinsus marinus (strain ATCC 50983 / TXsc) TaxID=423536 RepID=C5KRC7_PERM5|nr:hypothetical protein Pmar_PMAR014168 [Perkinsus marinus ATCC 50983]EER12966.1 hypothetical protein Pmar_PMAR014168 [Perkinsus marinus ATCC 50983]|eukprot:XP_002781171.1 hypothetical protein Pmar_PMAR014168 [Perkinsus marinus ATCC 50983]
MSEQQQQQQKLRITCSQRALLSDLSVLLLEQYEGTIGASSDEGSKEDLDPIHRWIGSTPGAMDLLVELSCKTATANDACKAVMASDDSNRSRPDTAEVYTAGPTETGQLKSAGVALPGMKAPAVKGQVMQPTLATVPEQASPAANPQKTDDLREGPKSKLLSNLVDELILLLSNTPWMCASLAQLLPLLSAASKDLVRQQQVTQGDLISASGEDLTLVTGTDILVYTGAVERMASLLQAQQQQQQQQQQGTPNDQQGLQTPLGSLQQQQFAMRLQAAHAAAGGGGSTPGMFQTELARPPVLGEAETWRTGYEDVGLITAVSGPY